MSKLPSHQNESSSSLDTPQSCRELTFSEIQVATENFDESLVIGRGGFGKVFKGTITDGANILTVAIKRLESTSNQGAEEFWSEVNMLSKLRHCHLVSLIGYCKDGRELILVYEYMPRGTLQDHLHKGRSYLPWVRRLKICIGAARGLDYLHTGTGTKHGVIHRDVKSSNILLYDNFEAKISDFGLSKICPRNQQSTHVSTIVKGTFGYLDPNYFYSGKLTRKSDVYAFGVVMFELLCGKRAVDTSPDEEQPSLAIWAQDSIKEGRLKQIVETSISGQVASKCLKVYAQIAKGCLHKHPKQRPTMAEVIAGLESILTIQVKANNTIQSGSMSIFDRIATIIPPAEYRILKYYQLRLDAYQVRQFDFHIINVATRNFSDKIKDDRLISIYKGRLQNGQDIAVISTHSHLYYEDQINEASILVNLGEHKNLVKLLGYCMKETTLLFIYEFVGHSSLDDLLFDPTCNLLDWTKRHDIILGVARVLLYIHKHAPIRIIHGDVRARNVLLDANLDPKLSNFSYAAEITDTDNVPVTVLPGTLYIGPKLMALRSHLSTKEDVFDFGVLVLETINAFRETEFDNDIWLVNYVRKHWLVETYGNIIDPRMDVDSSVIAKFIDIGLLCVANKATDRPTMEEVVDMLLGHSSVTLLVSKMRARMPREISEL